MYPIIIPTYGIIERKPITIPKIVTMIIKTIKNPIILKIPISFMSSIISPNLNASSKDPYLANLHNPTVLKIANIRNKIIPTIRVTVRPVAKEDQA